MDDTLSSVTVTRVAVHDGQWRVEFNYKTPLVVVFDGKRTATNHSILQPDQLKEVNPITQLKAIATAHNRHPARDSVLFDGVLCLHAKVKDGDDECETWVDAKTGFPKKFIATRGDRRTMSFGSKTSPPNHPATRASSMRTLWSHCSSGNVPHTEPP